MALSEEGYRQGLARIVCYERDPIAFSIHPGVVLRSTANLREHHHAKAKRVAALRTVGRIAGMRLFPRSSAGIEMWRPEGVIVLLRRVAPRTLDDDNLANALKAVRDGVAQWLDVDDRDPLVTYVPDQRKGPAALEVELYRW